MHSDRYGASSGRPRRATPLALLSVGLLALGPSFASAQTGNGGGTPEADSVAAAEAAAEAEAAARIARADSIRATLRQPAGDRAGLTAMDVIRAPFQLVSGALTLAFVAGVGVYQLLDETGVGDEVMDARDFLARSDLYVDPDLIGSRSWPALVATYRGLDPLFFQAGYSLRHYELYGAGLELGDEDMGAEVAGRYHLQRELSFWGVGPASDSGDRSDFALTRTEAGASAWTDFGGPVRLRLGSTWERSDVDRGFDSGRPDLQDTFDPDALFGAGRTLDFLRWDAGVDADLTTTTQLQRRGIRLIGAYRIYQGIDGTEADFQRVAADLRTYLPVNPRQSFAVRFLAEDHLGEGADGVPFTHLAQLGDDDGLRGYSSRRFHDRALLAGQAEWRYEVWWHPGNPRLRVEGFAFGDYGAVGASLSDMAGDDFRFTPGVGLRLTKDAVGLAEAYLAFGGDAPRADASIGVTF